MQKLWRWFQEDIQQNDGFLYSRKLINDIILKRELLFLFFSALCSLFHWIFYVTAFWIKIQVKTPTNTPAKNRRHTLIKSKIGFHLTLLLSNQDAICILYFFQQIMQISGCLQLSSRILMKREATPALRSFATWWRCNLHLPAQEVRCLLISSFITSYSL